MLQLQHKETSFVFWQTAQIRGIIASTTCYYMMWSQEQEASLVVACSSSCTTSFRLITIKTPTGAFPTFLVSLFPSRWTTTLSLTSVIQHATNIRNSSRRSRKKMFERLLQFCCMQCKSWNLMQMLTAFSRLTNRAKEDLCANMSSSATTQVHSGFRIQVGHVLSVSSCNSCVHAAREGPEH